MKEKINAGLGSVKNEMTILLKLCKKGIKEREGKRYLIWLFLSFIASGAKFTGGFYPFGIAMTGAFAFTPLNLFVSLGATIGYIFFLSNGGLAYLGGVLVLAAAGVMIPKEQRNSKLIPLISAVAIFFTSGVLKISWDISNLPYVLGETIMASVFSYCYTLTDKKSTPEQKNIGISCIYLTLVMFFSGMHILGELSISRAMIIFAILLYMYVGNAENSVLISIGFGMLMDISKGNIYYSGIYGITSTLMGAFRVVGRLQISLIYTILTALITFIYKNNAMAFASMSESFMAVLIFSALPECVLERLGTSLYYIKTEETCVKKQDTTVLKAKVLALSNAICHMSDMVSDITKNYYKSNTEDISKVFDRAADGVCRKCPISTNCWDKESVTTYGVMNDITKILRKKGYVSPEDFPHHFSSKCINIMKFIGAINEEYSLFVRRKVKEKSEEEQRAFVAKQYLGIHKAINSIEENTHTVTKYYPEYEKRVNQILSCYDLGARASVYTLEGRMCIEIFKSTKDLTEDLEQITDSIALSLGREFGKSQVIDIKKGKLWRIKEKEKFSVNIRVGIREKEGEKISGDNHMYFVTDDGRAILMLSDGMGSGQEASVASKNALSLISRFVKAGCSIEESVMAVLPVISMNVEKIGFATLDLLEINMFTGESKLLKYGAPPTYIKRFSKVQKYISSDFPPGLEENTEKINKPTYFKLNEGNIVIMGTDGVLEMGDVEEMEAIIKTEEEPQRLINELLEKAYNNKEKAKDDMTIIVAILKNIR